jgi:hypothetical protein
VASSVTLNVSPVSVRISVASCATVEAAREAAVTLAARSVAARTPVCLPKKRVSAGVFRGAASLARTDPFGRNGLAKPHSPHFLLAASTRFRVTPAYFGWHGVKADGFRSPVVALESVRLDRHPRRAGSSSRSARRERDLGGSSAGGTLGASARPARPFPCVRVASTSVASWA